MKEEIARKMATPLRAIVREHNKLAKLIEEIKDDQERKEFRRAWAELVLELDSKLLKMVDQQSSGLRLRE